MPEEAKGVKEQPRDAYGFEVKKEYLDLHKKYAPLWAKEEQERRRLWQDYLNSFPLNDNDAANGKDPHQIGEDFNSGPLEKVFLQHQAAGGSPEDDAWLQQLKTFVQAGIPMDLRGRLWKIFLQGNEEREPEAYSALVSQALAPQFQNSKKVGERVPFIEPRHLKGNSGRILSVELVEESLNDDQAEPDDQENGSSTDWNAQIEKDLHRTFPGHPLMDRSGRRSLRRILSAYACRNPNVGYCQGMNFVAGCLLLFMEEEDAFWCLTVIVEKLLPGYFDTTMSGSQVDQLVFRKLIEGQFGRLSGHLDGLGVSPVSVSTQWFLCIYVNSLPLETCLRVWDIFFLERCSSVLYRVALALIDIYAQALMATVDTIDAFILLQNMAPLSYDSSRLVDVACIAYQAVNHQHMQQLRSNFEEAVNAGIQERISRTMTQSGQYQGRKARTASASGSELDLPPGVPVGEQFSREELELVPSRAQLKMQTSKAAQTAYQIASQPAAKELVDREDEDSTLHAHASDVAGYSAFNEQEYTREDLVAYVKKILDKRKDWLADDNEVSEKAFEARVIHLKTLFARLEDEQFKLDAEEYELQVREEECKTSIDHAKQEIEKVQSSIRDREEKVEELRQRRDKEAGAVQAGRKRAEHMKVVLQRASAHRGLKQSLMQEKQELIKSLQQEIQQASAKPSGSFLSAFRTLSLRRVSRDQRRTI